MANLLDAGALEQRACQVLDRRIVSGRFRVSPRQPVTELQAKLSDAERENVRAWAYPVALRDSWTVDELHQLGLTDPEHT
jgi:hypothetical protein